MGNALTNVWTVRPVQEDLVDARLEKREPYDQVNGTHVKRLAALFICEAALIWLLFVPLTYVHVFTTSSGSWFSPLLLAGSGLVSEALSHHVDITLYSSFRHASPWPQGP
jgi:hypothetical protein